MFALAYFSVGVLCGQQSPKINVQGILRNAKGITVDDGMYTVTFGLYTVRTGGTAVWQETADVEVSGGIYSHGLGSVTPLEGSDFSTTLYLGVRLNGSDLNPRTELTYAPYTFNVSSAVKVACSGAVGDVKYSILGPEDFAKVNGDCWVPMNGGALDTASRLSKILGINRLPDGGGVAIRAQEFVGGQDNDPDRTPSSPIATLQSDTVRSHTHSMQTAGSHTHDYIRYIGAYGNVSAAESVFEHAISTENDQLLVEDFGVIQPAGNHTHTLSNTGGAATRQKNLNFWVYIRVN